eukprot:4526363-Lingulodinium_polyedra.AAC.1
MVLRAHRGRLAPERRQRSPEAADGTLLSAPPIEDAEAQLGVDFDGESDTQLELGGAVQRVCDSEDRLNVLVLVEAKRHKPPERFLGVAQAPLDSSPSREPAP